MHWEDLIRLVNAATCAVAFVLLLKAAYGQWHVWNFKTQMHWWALTGWVLLCIEGSIEAQLLGVEPGPRTVFTTLVSAWTIRALLIQDKLEAEGPGTHQHRTPTGQ